MIGFMQGQHSRQNSFCGMIYEDLISPDHLLHKLAAAVDFSFVSELVLFKVVFLQFLAPSP